jgi:preprotein translocase SecE subunit
MAEKGTLKADALKVKRAPRMDTHPLSRYFQELRMEWNKITFPERKELYRSTVVVFIFTVLMTIIVSIFDATISFIFSRLLPS